MANPVDINENAYTYREERVRDAAYAGLLQGIHDSLQTIAGELVKLNESKTTTKK
jgi:hypothetical protein